MTLCHSICLLLVCCLLLKLDLIIFESLWLFLCCLKLFVIFFFFKKYWILLLFRHIYSIKIALLYSHTKNTPERVFFQFKRLCQRRVVAGSQTVERTDIKKVRPSILIELKLLLNTKSSKKNSILFFIFLVLVFLETNNAIERFDLISFIYLCYFLFEVIQHYWLTGKISKICMLNKKKESYGIATALRHYPVWFINGLGVFVSSKADVFKLCLFDSWMNYSKAFVQRLLHSVSQAWIK